MELEHLGIPPGAENAAEQGGGLEHDVDAHRHVRGDDDRDAGGGPVETLALRHGEAGGPGDEGDALAGASVGEVGGGLGVGEVDGDVGPDLHERGGEVVTERNVQRRDAGERADVASAGGRPRTGHGADHLHRGLLAGGAHDGRAHATRNARDEEGGGCHGDWV